jgi:soluble lytic murein transglycosylase
VKDRPALADLALYLRARNAARAGEDAAALEAVGLLGERVPDSIWLPGARLLAGQIRRKAGDLEGARALLLAARDGLPSGSDRWVSATLALGDVAHLRGDDATALDLARAVRAAKPAGIALRRARRLTTRVQRRSPALFETSASRLAEGELLLGEDDAASAAVEAAGVLAATPSAEERAQAVWIRARAERALGQRADAEASCLEVARSSSTLGPRALAAAARWRWNGDDDAGALRLYRQLIARFASSPEAPEARYAIGRIQQEAGRYDEAFDTYDRLARDAPRSSVAPEARWRAGWVRYLGGDLEGAAGYFDHVVEDGPPGVRAASAYWSARIRGTLRAPDSDAALSAVVSDYPATYYAGLAAERLGEVTPDARDAVAAPPPAPFPDDLTGPHADRARALAALGFPRLARRELDAIGDDAPKLLLAEAYTAVDAPGPGIMTARGAAADGDDTARRFLYPLGFWPVVEQEADARGLDPLLVASLIRQESLFLPDAVSPADAHGLMQLLPRTAREVAAEAGVATIDRRALHAPATNVRLGTTLLRRLLDRYDGSRAKALAAYNAGEDAVTKWERRYGRRDDDEFTELISFRETRDYVKLVLGNFQVYRRLYAARPLAASSAPDLAAR